MDEGQRLEGMVRARKPETRTVETGSVFSKDDVSHCQRKRVIYRNATYISIKTVIICLPGCWDLSAVWKGSQ